MPDPLAPLGGPGQAQPLAPAPVPSPSVSPARSESAIPAQTAATASPRSEEAQAKAAATSRTPRQVPLEEAAKAFREFLKALPADLQYSMDDETGTVVFKVVNPLTKEVIRQYPPEELLEVARRLARLAKGEEKSGILLDQHF